MYLLRKITESDEEAFVRLSLQTQLGLTSIPKNPVRLRKKIENSVHSFANGPSPSGKDRYLFVLEHVPTGEIVGVSGILSAAGVFGSVHMYHIISEKSPEDHQFVIRERKLLQHINFQGPTEVGSLFLSKDHRKGGAGKLLSLGRFLYIAKNRHRFKDETIANMRGVIYENEISPFWNGIGYHFTHLDFNILMDLVTQNIDVADQLPRRPIYIDLLPKEVQNALGEVHEMTKPALYMLQKQGFVKTNFIDIYDGGPVISAKTDSINIIQQARTYKIKAIVNHLEEPMGLIANGDFYVTLAPIKVEADGVTLLRETADMLKVKDEVLYAEL